MPNNKKNQTPLTTKQQKAKDRDEFALLDAAINENKKIGACAKPDKPEDKEAASDDASKRADFREKINRMQCNKMVARPGIQTYLTQGIFKDKAKNHENLHGYVKDISFAANPQLEAERQQDQRERDYSLQQQEDENPVSSFSRGK